ncbi:DUF5615 family PIN-like protein [uncultured Enterovirga sp.]|uniref:DUF5615 family PIN-like protein n=1 Tax=uncultured Enterovirga sp. TaxID=2026352 RepID=UPI0035CB9C51
MIDTNLSAEWVPALAEVGIKAIHWSSIGREDAPDEEIMDWAQANDAVVLSRDLDFGSIVTLLGLRSPSVVQLRIRQVDHTSQAVLVRRVLSLQSEQFARGAIVTVESERVRVRRLEPFNPFENEIE